MGTSRTFGPVDKVKNNTKKWFEVRCVNALTPPERWTSAPSAQLAIGQQTQATRRGELAFNHKN